MFNIIGTLTVTPTISDSENADLLTNSDIIQASFNRLIQTRLLVLVFKIGISRSSVMFCSVPRFLLTVTSVKASFSVLGGVQSNFTD